MAEINEISEKRIKEIMNEKVVETGLIEQFKKVEKIDRLTKEKHENDADRLYRTTEGTCQVESKFTIK